MKYPNLLSLLSLLLVSAVLVSCGGGGGSSATPAATTAAPAPSAPVITTGNVVPLVVDQGPSNARNVPVGAPNSPYVSVSVCVPGSTTQCQTVDHVLVDTGSSGLRLLASALPAGFALPSVTTGSQQAIAACGQFANSYTWGSLKQADVRMAGELAAAISVQLIGDNTFPFVPSDCSSGLPSANTVDTLKANGVLGISTFLNDCGPSCAVQPVPGTYYVCTLSSCTSVALRVAQQLVQPVAKFAKDNNGTVIQLPAVGATGATSVSGSLTFGIATQTNNTLGGASVYTLDSQGNMSTLYRGKTLPSFFDSGSNGFFFIDSSIATCGDGFYCPTSTLALSAVNTGTNGTNGTVNFSVANASALTGSNPGYSAFGNLAGLGATARSFDWGLPFFFGRSVYTAIEGQLAGTVVGPYVAY